MSDDVKSKEETGLELIGVLNKYPKLALILVVLLMGGAPNIGKLIFPAQCDPELSTAIQNIEETQTKHTASYAEAKEDRKSIKIKQTEIQESQQGSSKKLGHIEVKQAIMNEHINIIKDDIKENKEAIKALR